MTTLARIDVGRLFELLWAAPLAGVVVSLTFAIALLGFIRAAGARREGSGAAATGYGALGFVALAAFLATVAFGVSIILAKQPIRSP